MDSIKLLIHKLQSIRSYGEGLKEIAIALNLSYINKTLRSENDQLFHYEIQKALGFKTPSSEVKTLEQLAIMTNSPPPSFFYGFFQIRYTQDPFTEFTWTYYRVKTFNDIVEFTSNDNKVIKFIGEHYFTKDYFILRHKGDVISIYHMRPLEENRIFYNFLNTIKWWITVVQREDGVIIGNIGYANFNLKYIKNDGSVRDININSQFLNLKAFGYYGQYTSICYESGGGKTAILDYFEKKERPVCPAIKNIPRAVSIKNVYAEIDAFTLIDNIVFFYDSKNERIAWFLNISEYKLRIFDGFVIVDRDIVDLITGRILIPSCSDSMISLTRKDDDTGYWIWVHK